MRNFLAVTFLFIALSCFIPIGFSQNIHEETDASVMVYPVEQAQKLGKVNLSEISGDWFPYLKNTQVIHQPGTNTEKDQFLNIKARSNEEMKNALERSVNNFYSESGSFVSSPVIGYNFNGNGYSGAVPNDNNIAVGNDGKTISVINTNIKISNINGQILKVVSLDGFAGSVVGNDTKYDPVCTFDPVNNRYIIVFLSGYTSTTSKIVVAFSQTSQPEGYWNIYAINGNASGSVWTDFPQIGISTEELFITGNLFNNSGYSQGAAIWQVELAGGYSGETSITFKKYVATNYFSMHPVEGGINLYGPEFYLIRSVSGPQNSSTSIFLHKITNTIANNGTLAGPVNLISNISYKVPPDSPQKNSGILLQTNDCRIQTSYIEHNEIQFALNSSSGGRACIFLGRIQLNTSNLGLSVLTAVNIYSSTYHYAYPSIAYGGAINSSGRNSSLLFFNYSSSVHFPGNAAIFIDTSGNVSSLVICKEGYNYVGSNSPFRWGDYSGGAERKNNPGEVWVAGSYVTNSNTYGTWITQLATPDVMIPIGIDEVNQDHTFQIVAYPNPAVDIINFDFKVDEQGIYSACIYDLNGNLVRELIKNILKPGTAKIEFNVSLLAPGTYMILISGKNENIWKSKFVVPW